MSNVQDNAAPGIYHGNLISSLQSMRDRMMAVLVPKFGEAFDGDFDAMLEAINALKRIDTSPNGGTNALSRAYGYLWHVNHPEDIPTGHPFMSADRAAIEARKELRDMLTHEQRGAGINWVRQSLIDASPKGGSEARDAVVVEGVIEFRRSSTSEPKLCVCCPGEPSHIFGRSVNWEGECWAQFNALETAIRKHFTYKNENEGRRLRVTIEVVQAQAGDAEVRP